MVLSVQNVDMTDREHGVADPNKVITHPSANLPQVGDVRTLVEDMSYWRKSPEPGTHVVLINFAGAVPQAKHTTEMLDHALTNLRTVAAKRQFKTYQIAPSEFAVMANASGQLALELIQDLKISMLRVVERHCPASFGAINQNRFLMLFDLTANFRGAAERISKYAALAQESVDTGEEEKKAPRPLSVDDLQKVMQAYRKFGSEKFLKAFIRDQVVARCTDGHSLQPDMHEYYVSMDILRKPLFIDVEMRASGHLFKDFTRILDQIVLGSFQYLHASQMPFSVNCNVSTVFTATFADFMDAADKDLLKRMTFEFRQADVVEHFDEFEVAKGVIHAMGASIGVDHIFPQTLGLVDLDYIGAKYAKVHWQPDAIDTLRERRKAFQYMKSCGVEPIMIRVGSGEALKIGAELGVEKFQGFYIDDSLRKKAA